MKSSPFRDFCADQFPTADASLAAFFGSASDAAASVGALLESPSELILDGSWHYLRNLDGKRDSRQSYIGKAERSKDGTYWPVISFKSFKTSEQVTWSPRDLAWQLFMSADRKTIPPAPESYAKAAEEARAANAEKAKAAELAKNEGRKAAAIAAKEVWEASGPCTEHPYATNKRIQAQALRVATKTHFYRLWHDEQGEWINTPAAKAGELLIPIYDRAGDLVNLQRIDPRPIKDNKRPITGGLYFHGHHRIEGETGRTVLTEGYATGATWHEATGDTVIVCFCADNLSNVAEYVRADFVAADHDASRAGEKAAQATGLPYLMPYRLGDWNDHGPEAIRGAIANEKAEAFPRPYGLPEVELKGREQTWWNKLGNAESAPEAAALAWAIARRLSIRVPVVLSLDELMDRVRDASPVGLMNPRTLIAFRDALSRVQDWRQRRALAGICMSAEAMERHTVEDVSELPNLGPDDYQGLILLNAPMGSGKTQHVGRPFAAWAKSQEPRLIATCHRQSLVSELSRVLGCSHYQETGADEAWAVRSLATCLPSLVKGTHSQIVRDTGFVFVDEIAQVLRSIASKVTVADRKTWPEVFQSLRELVSNADCLIGADAGMDDRVLAFLESCRPGERFRVIRQAHKDEGLSVSFGFGPDALATAYGEAMARLIEGQKLWIGCGERARAIEAARVLSATGARILLLHGDNRESKAQAAFWANPEAESREYDAVIHTGVISSGMSIEHRESGEYFDHGMFLGSGAKITPADAMQMLRRVRYLKSWTVAVTPNNAKDIDNADAILVGMVESAAIEGFHVESCTSFDAFVAGIEADNARHRADFAAGLWWALNHQGFTVERMLIEADSEVKAGLKVTRAAIRDEKRAAILEAPDITESEAKRIRDKQGRTEEEAAALIRHRIRTDLGTETVNDESIDAWDEGRGPRRMDRFSAATQGLADRNDNQGEDLALHRFGKARAIAYKWLFDGIDLGPELRINADLATDIVRRVIERRYLLAFLKIVPAKWARHLDDGKVFPLPAYPVREVGEILERMGLELRRREGTATLTSGDIPLEIITASEGKSTRQYRHEVTRDSWETMTRLAEQRNRRRYAEQVQPLSEIMARAFRPIRVGFPTVLPMAPVIGRTVNVVSIGSAYRRFRQANLSPGKQKERAATRGNT